jgi:uncharacterized membrane protein
MSTEPTAPVPVAPPSGGELGTHKESVQIVWGLYLGSFLLPLLMIAGLVVAYIKRGETTEPGPLSHYNRQIKLFWMSLIGMFIGLVLLLIVIGYFVLIGVAIWVLVVSIIGMVKASEGKAYP